MKLGKSLSTYCEFSTKADCSLHLALPGEDNCWQHSFCTMSYLCQRNNCRLVYDLTCSEIEHNNIKECEIQHKDETKQPCQVMEG